MTKMQLSPKVLTDKELAEIIKKVVTENLHIDDAGTYKHFLKDVAEIVTDYFGGSVGDVRHDSKRKEWVVEFQYDSNVLEGGIYDEFDKEVSWEESGEPAEEDDSDKETIKGDYHRYGYRVYTDRNDGQPLFTEGNSVGGVSCASILEVGHDSLDSIKNLCEKITRQFAREKDAIYGGISYDPNAEDDYLCAMEGDRVNEARALIAAENEDGNEWSAHPYWTREEWINEVSAGDTQRSYWDWVASQIEQVNDEREQMGMEVLNLGKTADGTEVELLSRRSAGDFEACGLCQKDFKTEVKGWVIKDSNNFICPDCSATLNKRQPCIRFEYDRNFFGGDYSDVGNFASVPVSLCAAKGYKEAFESQTGVGRCHIIHYSQDELFTLEGEPFEEES